MPISINTKYEKVCQGYKDSYKDSFNFTIYKKLIFKLKLNYSTNLFPKKHKSILLEPNFLSIIILSRRHSHLSYRSKNLTRRICIFSIFHIFNVIQMMRSKKGNNFNFSRYFYQVNNSSDRICYFPDKFEASSVYPIKVQILQIRFKLGQ